MIHQFIHKPTVVGDHQQTTRKFNKKSSSKCRVSISKSFVGSSKSKKFDWSVRRAVSKICASVLRLSYRNKYIVFGKKSKMI